jgi:voltage-gated potassium channel Kch
LLLPALLTSVLLVIVAAAAAAAIETNTVGSFPRGLWWAISLITTVGFIGEPPETTTGAVLSALLMIVGFVLLAMVSASLAALFVREEEEEPTAALEARTLEILARLERLEQLLQARELPTRSAADAEEGRADPPADR